MAHITVCSVFLAAQTATTVVMVISDDDRGFSTLLATRNVDDNAQQRHFENLRYSARNWRYRVRHSCVLWLH